MLFRSQTLFYKERYSHTVFNDSVDFVKVAEALGCVGMRVRTKEEFVPAFKKALELNRPVVIDCQIEKDDKVFPMVSPGASICEAFDENDLKK